MSRYEKNVVASIVIACCLRLPEYSSLLQLVSHEPFVRSWAAVLNMESCLQCMHDSSPAAAETTNYIAPAHRLSMRTRRMQRAYARLARACAVNGCRMTTSMCAFRGFVGLVLLQVLTRFVPSAKG